MKAHAASLILLVCFLGTARAEDWPTYLHDATRGGASAEQLALPLAAGWTYTSPAPPPRAFSGPTGRTIEGKVLHDRVRFDDAFQVAVVGDRLYFGSSVDHQVHCVDARNGAELWSFFTGAAVRLAPTVTDGRVFVGSDDGYAYCLDARDGKLIWKYRPGPADEWMIGRGEMTSRWPVRTGVLVRDGIAYFGAGVFPHENVYLCAVKAADGTVVWRNDHISHDDAGRNDLSPQGYLLASSTKLYIPSSRTRPWSLDPKTGAVSPGGARSLKFSESTIAGTDGLVASDALYIYSLGTRLAVRGTDFIAADGKQLSRLVGGKFMTANREKAGLETKLRLLSRDFSRKKIKEEDYRKQAAELRAKIKKLVDVGVAWHAPCAAEGALIIAGDLVFAGGHNLVTAHNFKTGEQVWKAEVEGEARGLAVANGRLYVSTTAGKIYSFRGANTPAAKSAVVNDAVEPFPPDRLSKLYAAAAEEILKNAGNERGYCLVVGNERGRLAYELARRGKLKIYAIEPDADKVAAARKALAAARVYGSRVSVHQAHFNDIPYSNYFANLIVSDTMLLEGKLNADAEAISKHLKPAGGKIILGGSNGNLKDAVAWLEKTKLGKQATLEKKEPWALLTRGTLPGAGNWSHQYAEPGNTANSGDKLVKGGLGVLWYGDPGPGQMVNRHQGAVGPLVVNGRMFIQGEDSLMAYDAYNGMFLWEQKNPEAIRTGVFRNELPGNLAAGGDSLFHMVRDKVFEHDVATGKVKAVHVLPDNVDKKTHEWGYVAYKNGVLYGTATIRDVIAEARRRRGKASTDSTDAIFAIDVKTGKHLWSHQGKSIAHHTIAIGPERVYFIDSTITSEQRAAILREDKSELKKLTGEDAKRAEARLKKLDVRLAVAVDARTGKQQWAKPVDVTDCSDIGIGGGKLTLMYHNGVVLLCGANANGHYWKQFVTGEFKRRRLVALSAEQGYKLWSKDANYRHRPIIIGDRVIAEPWGFDLHDGKQQTRKHPLTGKDVPWSIIRPGHHCGMLTGCDNLLLFRSGYTGFYDLESDSGTRHFAGHRLGCWINAIPTNGLVVIPEASAGCVCMFSIASTIVLEPRSARRPWTIYSGVGATTPVEQMALNFGAPGDRRDAAGKLWLAYPRPAPKKDTSLDLSFRLITAFSPPGRFYSANGDKSEKQGGDAWLHASGSRGLKSCKIPLLGKEDKPGLYNLRLHLLAEPGDKPGARVFDVYVQGKRAHAGVDVAAQAKKGLLLLDVKDVVVEGDLQVELRPSAEKPSAAQLPILSAIEVQRQQTKKE